MATEDGRDAASKGPVGAAAAAAKDQAASVVLAYREVDWEAVEKGEPGAVDQLLRACERHDVTAHFLDADCGELGQQLVRGLERFYAENVGPHLRRPAVLSQVNRSAPDTEVEDGLIPRARPSVTVGHTVRMNTGCGHLYVTINETEDGTPFELFNHMGKAGGCAASQNEAIGRLISYALRCGASIEPLIKQLKGISCHRPAWGEEGKISSCSDAIGKALEKYYAAREVNEFEAGPAAGGGGRDMLVAERLTFTAEPLPKTTAGNGKRASGDVSRVQGACVDCGGQLSYEEGCVKCHSCGFTECG